MLLTTPQVTAVFSGNNLSLSLPNTAGEAVTLTVNYCNSTECYISVVGATFNTTGASQFSGSGSTTLTYTAPIDGLTDNGLIGSLSIGGPSTSASTVTTDTIDTVNLNEVGLEEANSALSVNAAQINLNNSTTSIDVTNLTLTSVNSLNWATMGVDYQGTTTVNAPPVTGQPFAGDVSFVGNYDWGNYGYSVGETVYYTENNSAGYNFNNYNYATVAAIIGTTMYIENPFNSANVSTLPATGTCNLVLQANDSTAIIRNSSGSPGAASNPASLAQTINLTVTGTDSSISGAFFTYGVVTLTASATGNITLQDSGNTNNLLLGNISAGTNSTLSIAANSSIFMATSTTSTPFVLQAAAINLLSTSGNNATTAINVNTQGNGLQSLALSCAVTNGVGASTTTGNAITINDTTPAGLTIGTLYAQTDFQSATVNGNNIEYNSTANSSTATYVTGNAEVSITSTGPVVLNTISATGNVTVTGSSILEGDEHSPNITTPQISLNATGQAEYQGTRSAVVFAQGFGGDTLTIANGANWSLYDFAAGQTIFISGAISSANNGRFTIASLSGSTLTLTQSDVVVAETEGTSLCVGNGIIGQPSTLASSSGGAASSPDASISLTNVPLFSAVTQRGSIYLDAGGAVNSTAVNVTANSYGYYWTNNVTVSSSAPFLSIQNIFADGGTAAVMMSSGYLLDAAPVSGKASGINGANVYLQSPYNLGTPTMPLYVNTGGVVSANATATTRSSAGVYICDAQPFSQVAVNTYDGNVTIYSGTGLYNGTQNSVLFQNNLLTENGNALVSLCNTNNIGGSFGNVLISGTINANTIQAGIGSDGSAGTGQILMSSSGGSINGSGGTVTLIAGGGIGVGVGSTNGFVGTPINVTNVFTINASTTTGNIGLNVTKAATSTLTLSASSATGNIYVSSGGSIATASQMSSQPGVVYNSISAPGVVDLNAYSNISNTNNSTISAGTLILTATNGSIGSPNAPLQVTTPGTSQAPGTLTLSAIAPNGISVQSNSSLTVTAATALTGSITLSAIGNIAMQGSSTSGGATNITATGGSVTQAPSSILTINNQVYSSSTPASPEDVAVDGFGNVYVVNSGSSNVLMFNANNFTVIPITNVNNSITNPSSIAVDGSGNLYVAGLNENGAGAVFKLNSVKNTWSQIVGNLNSPQGIAVDSSGNVWICNTGSGSLIELNQTNNSLTTITTNLHNPTGVAVDGSGNVYVANGINNDVVEYHTGNQTWTTLIKGLVNPNGVAVDGSGNVYISCTGNNSVQKYNPVSQSLNTLVSANLDAPMGIAVDSLGNIWIANSGLNNIVEYSQVAQSQLVYSASPVLGTGLTITANNIGSATDVIQVNSPVISVSANYGGIYLSNQNTSLLTLTAASVGTASGSTANTIEIYSAGNIQLQQQTNNLTQLATPLPVAILNPGGVLTLASGQTLSSSGTTVSGTYGAITSLASTATGTCSLNTTYGRVTSASVVNSGSGYLTPPQVTLSGGGGLGATATATINPLGQVTGITITTPGTGYTSAPTVTIASPGDDVYTGSYTINGQTSISSTSPLAVLVIVSGTAEVIPPNHGGLPVVPALVTWDDLMWSVYLAQQNKTTNITIANGTEQLNFATLTVTITAEAITIDTLGQSGSAGNATIPNGWSLNLVATAGNIVFLNPGDTITTTGTGVITITGQPACSASLGNLTTAGGAITINTGGNIAIGTLTAGKTGSLGAIAVTSTTGLILFNNASSPNLTGSPITLSVGAQPTTSGQSVALAQLNVTEVVAGANAAYSKAIAIEAAASATVAAELAAVNSFNVYLPKLQKIVNNDQSIYQAKNAKVGSDQQSLTAAFNAVNSLINQHVNPVAWTLYAADVGAAIGVAITTALHFGEVQAAFAEVAVTAMNAAGILVNGMLTTDMINLATAQQTLSIDESAANQAYATWQADLSSLQSFTAAANVATQAYQSSVQVLTNSQTNTAQVQAQGEANTANAVAGVIFASPSQPITVSSTNALIIENQNKLNGQLNVTSNMTSNTTINLQAGPGSNPKNSGDNLTVSSGVTVTSTQSAGLGSVNLSAGNNVLIQSGAIIQSSNNPITITANTNGDSLGATVTVAGTLVAPSVTIGVGSQATGNEIFNITPSATTPITVNGGSSSAGANTLNFNANGLSVIISGNSITAVNQATVTFTGIQKVVILNAATSLTLSGTSGVANTMSLVGSGQGAGTATLNGVSYSFSSLSGFNYQGGGAGDTLAVTPFLAIPMVPWNLNVSVNGGTGTPANITYHAPDPYSDVIATGNSVGNVVDPGVGTIAFANVNQVTLAYQESLTVEKLPVMTLNAPNVSYNGQAFVATAQINGGTSVNGITPKITYYTGTNLNPKFKLTGAPVNVGTYTAVANFSGNNTWVSETISARMTISQGSQTITYTPLTNNTITVVPNKQLTLKATGGNSGNPVIFTIDPASTPGAASISGNILTEYFPGTVIIDANQSGNTNYTAAPQVQQTLFLVPGPASKIGIPQATGTVTAGQALPPISATIQDQYGNTVTSSTGSVTITATVGGKSVSFASGTTTVSAVNGVATFTNLSLTTAGNAQFTVSSKGLTSGTSSSFTVAPATATKIVVPQTTGTVTAGKAIPTNSATIFDQYGNTVTSSTASVTVTATVGGNPASFASGTTTVSAINGVATFANLVLTTAGTAQLTVSSNGLTSGTSNSFTVTPATASQVVISQTPVATSQVMLSQTTGTVIAGNAIPTNTATIQDQYGNTVTSSTAIVTVTATVGGKSARFASGFTTVLAVHGVAIFTNLSLTTAGIAQLKVSSNRLTSGTGGSFTVLPATAAKIVLSQTTGTVIAGNALPTSTATIQDQYGNIVTSSTDSVTVTATVGGKSTSFASGTTTVSAVNGVATFTNLRLTTAGIAQLTVLSKKLTSGIGNRFTVAPAPRIRL